MARQGRLRDCRERQAEGAEAVERRARRRDRRHRAGGAGRFQRVAETIAGGKADDRQGRVGKPAKPRALKAPRKSGADDLKEIKGVGPKLEALLNTLGFYHFDQIADWTEAELAWVDDNLEGFKGRASRDGWIGQARTLTSGGQTEFSSRVKKGDVY